MVIGAEELAAPLRILPEVEFCCAYGSSLLPNNTDKTAMVDYILGVSDPFKWHSENLERNRGHYASWMACLGPNAIAHVADVVGVGVHFNPFVPWKDKMIKYGVVRMQDLAYDVLTWNRFYLSGRLQKPITRLSHKYSRRAGFCESLTRMDGEELTVKVFVLVDNFDMRKVNKVNLKAAVAAALLLSPTEFGEEDLYSTICSLSYKGDLRMLFAEDKHKVKKIVKGSFSSFQAMYRPLVMEYSVEGLLEYSFHDNQLSFKQDCGLSATRSLFYSLPSVIQNEVRSWTGKIAGKTASQFSIASKEEAARYTRRSLRRLVMFSSARQVMSGLFAAGGVNAVQYLGNKMSKAWRSRTSC